MIKKNSLEFCIDKLISNEAGKDASATAEFQSLTERISSSELAGLWLVVTAFISAYVVCYLGQIPYASLSHSRILYAVFVGINIFAAVVSIHSWSRIPSRSIAKDAMLFITISVCSAAIGNSIDFLFWIFNIAPFKQSVFTNLFFVFAILFALPGVHLLGRVCRVEFSKQPLFYYLAIIMIYLAIPMLMNPELMSNFSEFGNLKEFIFGLLYAIGIGYLASVSLYLWRNAQGRLLGSASFISLGLVLLSFGCSIYAGLFPRVPAVEIPSSPVHIILALGYIATALGVRRTEITINTIFNLKDSKLPPSLHLIEIFGPSQGLAVYKKMESHIREALEELLKSKAESEMKQRVISELETEVRLRKETERALIIEKEKAEEANKTKSQFLAMMSHELKTPLTSIKGYGQLLSNPSGPALNVSSEKIVEIASQIVNNSNHLQTMIDGLLRFSQLESGQFTYHKEEFFLREIVDYIESLLQQQQQFSPALFSSKIPEPDLKLFTDKLALQHILSNLLLNAFKFCKEGKIELEIRKSGNSLFIAVEDNGIGIAPQFLDKIFEAFFQISHGNRRKYGGAGLGLSIVKKITEELGGKIHVISEPEKGSRFEIFLPQTVT